MKTYKEFEIVNIGGSDGAALILASPEKLEYLYFGEDGEMGCLIYAPNGTYRR